MNELAGCLGLEGSDVEVIDLFAKKKKKKKQNNRGEL
jgi:hypothetical protein